MVAEVLLKFGFPTVSILSHTFGTSSPVCRFLVRAQAPSSFAPCCPIATGQPEPAIAATALAHAVRVVRHALPDAYIRMDAQSVIMLANGT
jgi:hypothetical protein